MKLSFALFAAILIPAVSLAGCGRAPAVPAGQDTLTVYAAASLTDAFTEIGRQFETRHPEVRVVFNFGGSQNLRTQLEQGAQADVFASANTKEMDALIVDQKIQSGASRVFLTNQLIVILPAGNPAGIASLRDLARPGLKLVLAAEDVPAGNYARQVLHNLNGSFGPDYASQVLANVVSNEDDVKQVVAKVQLGEADAGIVYVSDAVAAPALQEIAIPPEVNVLAQYPIAPLVGSTHPDWAAEFVSYALSGEAQAILKKWGFTPAVP